MNTQDVMQRLIRYNVGIQANKRLLMNHFHKCKTMTVTITRKVFIDNYISGPGQKSTNKKLVHETEQRAQGNTELRRRHSRDIKYLS